MKHTPDRLAAIAKALSTPARVSVLISLPAVPDNLTPITLYRTLRDLTLAGLIRKGSESQHLRTGAGNLLLAALMNADERTGT